MKETCGQCVAKRGGETGRTRLCLEMGKDLGSQRVREVLQRPDFRERKANIITGLKQGQHRNRADP